ncbi:hypothetical protein ZWY2020_000156 [Hordeum vulgare]|nr:hypothetical protein ZWY2020_000156 [Hordeum vulgare]
MLILLLAVSLAFSGPMKGEHHLDAGGGGLVAPPPGQESSHLAPSPQTSPKGNPNPFPVTGHLLHPRAPLTQRPPRGCVEVRINEGPCFLVVCAAECLLESYTGGLCRGGRFLSGACYCVQCPGAKTSHFFFWKRKITPGLCIWKMHATILLIISEDLTK